jgi:hypothetical protein
MLGCSAEVDGIDTAVVRSPFLSQSFGILAILSWRMIQRDHGKLLIHLEEKNAVHLEREKKRKNVGQNLLDPSTPKRTCLLHRRFLRLPATRRRRSGRRSSHRCPSLPLLLIRLDESNWKTGTEEGRSVDGLSEVKGEVVEGLSGG